jgi:magnesium transporter
MDSVKANLEDIRDAWAELDHDARVRSFADLTHEDSNELFEGLPVTDQIEILAMQQSQRKRSLLRILELDDTVDLIQHLPTDSRETALDLLDSQTRSEVLGLLAYAEDEAGGLMNPDFIRLRPDVSAEAAIRYIRAQARNREGAIHYGYVLDNEQRLMGVVSLRELLLASPSVEVRAIAHLDPVSIPEDMDQEEVSRLFKLHHYLALPVVDSQGRMKGIVTFDDAASVVEKEATEDMQKLGGMEALDLPYWKTSFFHLLRKRAGWLVILFVGEFFTATAMGHFEEELNRAMVLALFIPLIISSGGNSGSQASTLIIRELALREISLRYWWKVLGREILSGLALGTILGIIGMGRIMLWPNRDVIYGEHALLIAFTVSTSLVGVVLWGAVSGAMLPFILKKLGLDPASASAPFVATLVDVTGLVIYFTVASTFLHGTLL